MKQILIFSLSFLIMSCANVKNVNGNYYNTCYFGNFPYNIIKIKNNKFEIYSITIIGEKYIGNSKINSDVLYLYRTNELINNFKDTIVSSDTSKFVIKGRKLIPFKKEMCYFKKTNDKNKLVQLPYVKIDTSR